MKTLEFEVVGKLITGEIRKDSTGKLYVHKPQHHIAAVTGVIHSKQRRYVRTRAD